jgi:hypothetical protein
LVHDPRARCEYARQANQQPRGNDNLGDGSGFRRRLFHTPLILPRAHGKASEVHRAVAASYNVGMHEKPKRRWLQFSLRGLLLLMVLIAVPLGWTMNKMRQQRDTVDGLLKMNYRVVYRFDYESPIVLHWLRQLLGEYAVRSVVTVIGGSQATDAGLVHLQSLAQLQSLNLHGTQITDAGLAQLLGLPRLTDLNVGETQVTDAGLVHLRALPQLTELDLSYTRVTDAGLVSLQGLAQLQSLNLHGTQVTDAGLVHLKGLTCLTNLRLAGAQVTDFGLVQLRGLTQLRSLNLDGTQTTDAGVQKLQRALPNLQIIRLK